MKANKAAAVCIVLGITAFLTLTGYAALNYPGFSLADNYLSDLGVGSTALFFNTACVITGIFIIIAALFLLKKGWQKASAVLLAACGIALIGIGIFPKNAPLPHAITTYAFFALTPIFILTTSIHLLKQKNNLAAFSGTLLAFLFLYFDVAGINPTTQKILALLFGAWLALFAHHA